MSDFKCISSRSEVFCKKGVLKSFAKFTGKHLCHSLFFNKIAGLRSTALLKKSAQVFSCEFCEIYKNTLFTEHLRATACKRSTRYQFRILRNIYNETFRENSLCLKAVNYFRKKAQTAASTKSLSNDVTWYGMDMVWTCQVRWIMEILVLISMAEFRSCIHL